MNSLPERLQINDRRGSILVLSIFLIVAMLGILALAVDFGYAMMVRTQLQVAADSAAISAASTNVNGTSRDVIHAARKYSEFHLAAGEPVKLDSHDVEFGRWDFYRRSFTQTATDPNAIRIRTRRSNKVNGETPMFFARIFGINSVPLKTKAVAAVAMNLTGFEAPSNGENLGILPIALKVPSWEDLRAGFGEDNWTWNEDTGQVTPGPDGIPELTFYPGDVDSPGNFGTVDIGGADNSTADLTQQILEGIAPEDLEYHGGSLELGADGTLSLTGDPGLSARIGDALGQILGEPRVVPVYTNVAAAGNTAVYTITGFAGVRIMEVNLKGQLDQKRVVIQRSDVVLDGGIPARDGATQTSINVYSHVTLVQ